MPERKKPERGEASSLQDYGDQAETLAFDEGQSAAARCRAAERERDEYRALLQRTQADFENYQKRVQRDLQEGRRYAHADFARELLPVLDNLQRTLSAAQQKSESSSLVQGVSMIQSQLLEALRRFGVMPIDALGQPFDPNIHEAVTQRPQAGAAPGTVIDVLEPGYRLHDRVLRPAKVVVAMTAESVR